MRIALLTDGMFPYVIGGMQKISYHIAKQLAKNNHTVYLFHCHGADKDSSKLELFTEEEKKNIHQFVIPFPYKGRYPLHYIAESKQYSKDIYKALLPLLPDIDFVIAQGFCAWELLRKKQANTPPVAVHFHGFEMYQNIPGLRAKLNSYFLRNAVYDNLFNTDYAISYGGRITTILKDLIAAEKIWEVPGAIESKWVVDEAKPISNKIRFAFLGRFERRKGIHELNQALRKLITKKDLEFEFTFIGDIPDEHRIGADNIHYKGKIDVEDEIQYLLSQNDVLVAPSLAEGMPVAIMEAMANGLAIIATDVGSVSMLVGNDNGWLLPTQYPEIIAMAMRSAIKDKAAVQAKKAASIHKVKERFLVETTTKELMRLMEQHRKK